MVDTNFYIANHRPSAVLERSRAGHTGEVVCGAEKSQRVADNLERLERRRAQLEQKGRVTGAYDPVIAAHSLSLDVILVTNNTKEFSRVRGLKLENWVA